MAQKQRKIAVMGNRAVGAFACTTIHDPRSSDNGLEYTLLTIHQCSVLHCSLLLSVLVLLVLLVLLWRLPGKSSICVQFVDNHFVESYNPTIENTFVKELKYKGVNYSIELVDTAGQVRRIRELDILQCGRSIKLGCSQSHSHTRVCLCLCVRGIRYRNDPPLLVVGYLHLAIARQDDQELFQSQYAIGVHGYALVYSCASKASLEIIKVRTRARRCDVSTRPWRSNRLYAGPQRQTTQCIRRR